MIDRCPICGDADAEGVLRLPSVPTLPNARVADHEQAVSMTRGPIELVVCLRCTHLYNAAFDAALLTYDASYDNSLHFSPTFVAYAEELASDLERAFGLDGATIAEIGCGSADFLSILCERTASRGYGFDPSVDLDRIPARRSDRVRLAAAEYPLDGTLRPDLLITQHVLEHLDDPVGLLRSVVPSVRVGGGCYHEVPNGAQMIHDVALWDLIFEHVSYFVPASFRLAMTSAGLDPTAGGTSFGDQYLWSRSRPGAVEPEPPSETERSDALGATRTFARRSGEILDDAASRIDQAHRSGPVVLWGAGSKGVMFLNLVEGAASIEAVVDVNPRKLGTYVPGAGQVISGPEVVRVLEPGTVFVANPIYLAEIRRTVDALAPGWRAEPVWT